MFILGKRTLGVCAALLLVDSVMLFSAGPAPAAELQLITEDEAKLPSQKGAIATSNRGITRGPKIELVDTAKSGAVQSPMRLQLKFQSYGGAKIDTSTIVVTYLKTPAVDLTSRVKPFAQETGVDIPDAALPPGDHPLRIDVKDSDGRTATTNFVLKVAQ